MQTRLVLTAFKSKILLQLIAVNSSCIIVQGVSEKVAPPPKKNFLDYFHFG